MLHLWTRLLLAAAGLMISVSLLLLLIVPGAAWAAARALGDGRGDTLFYSAWTSLEFIGADLYRLDLTHNLTVRLAHNTQSHFDLAPADDRLVYSAYYNNDMQTFLLDLPTLRARPLTPGPGFNDRLPAFSPDGTQIAFYRNLDQQTRNALYLHLMNADGSNSRRLSELLVSFADVQWSPDGTQLAMLVLHDDYNRKIHIVDLATGRSRLLSQTQGMETAPRWSPDGQRIAYIRSGVGGPGLVIQQLVSGDERLIALDSTSTFLDAPVWSPDGRQLALSALIEDANGSARASVYVLDADDATAIPRRLTTLSNNEERPVWSPDGHWIAFVVAAHSGDGHLYLAAVGGDDLRLVRRNAGVVGMLAWR